MKIWVISCRVCFVCRTIESLYEELVDEGILVRHPKIQLSEFLGEFRYCMKWNSTSYVSCLIFFFYLPIAFVRSFIQLPLPTPLFVFLFVFCPSKLDVFYQRYSFSYLGSTLRQANIEPMPSLSDVRRIITEFCVLPLGK